MSGRAEVTTHVTMHVWGVPGRNIAAAAAAMARDRRPLRRTPGLSFGKLLGCGSGQTFTPRDTDLHHWGVLACWDSPGRAVAFESSALVARWDRRSYERLTVHLDPVSSRGVWGGRAPFGEPTMAPRALGPVAALTRARLAPRKAAIFWRAVPAVVADLHATHGLAMSLGIGEAPIGLQGTFSLWHSEAALREFAYRGAAHAEVVRRTTQVGWYREDLFARFVVLACEGTFHGRRPFADRLDP